MDKCRSICIDFGAVANPQVEGGGSTVAGTYGYMPPEQLMGTPMPQSDIYSLAVTAVQLFTGIEPEQMQIKDFHLLFEPYMQSTPAALIYTLRAMLEPKADKRFCNYDKLIDIFSEFKKGIYNIPAEIEEYVNIDPTENQKRQKQFDRDLQNVTAINGSGNIALWQQLSNITPRKMPRCYKKLRFFDLSAWLSSISIKKTVSFGDEPPLVIFLLKWAKYVLWMFGISLLIHEKLPESDKIAHCVLMAFYWMIMLIVVVALISDYFTYFLVYLGIMAIPALIGTVRNVHSDFEPVDPVGHSVKLRANADGADKKQLTLLFKQIVQFGTKTLATITDIQYVPQLDGVYLHVSKTLVSTRRPLFKISYRFNPADDSNPDDLTHCIYTHTQPEGHYQIGDPLPILYLVQAGDELFNRKTMSSKEVVYSIPFPIPLTDDLSLDKRIGRSELDFAF